MNLKWIERKGMDANGDRINRTYLADLHSGRLLGYIDPPKADELSFSMDTLEDCFLTMDDAKAELEARVCIIDQREAAQLEKFLEPKEEEQHANVGL